MNIYPRIKRKIHLRAPFLPNIYDEIEPLLNLKKEQITWVDNQTIMIDVNSACVSWHNSFSPKVTITPLREDETTLCVISQLRRSTQVMLLIFWTIAVAFEILMIAMGLSGWATFLPALLIPLGLVAFSYMLSVAGLWISSRPILHELECFFKS